MRNSYQMSHLRELDNARRRERALSRLAWCLVLIGILASLGARYVELPRSQAVKLGEHAAAMIPFEGEIPR